MSNPVLRVALMDLNDGAPNQGMRSLRQLLPAYAAENSLEILLTEFEVRRKTQIPDSSYQVYISTGGPGSPLDSEGSDWDNRYCALIRDLEQINLSSGEKKFVFFICHSFQLACRLYDLGEICLRKSPAFGVMPVNKTGEGFNEPLFRDLPDPFFAVESREWQVIRPNMERMAAVGANLCALEKERPRIPLERAMMAIRFSPWFFGTQFHPEADPEGMTHYLEKTEKKAQVIRQFGEQKYRDMLDHLEDPGMICLTRAQVIPRFLDQAVASLQETVC
ncbi:MAG TPA: hypothetical protein VMV20_03190 [Chitinophagaceae bacterium]|nr:hypothetical protein [Chitinophagaceae bacterium]